MKPLERDDLFPDDDTLIPRFREAGEVTLDLLHRDGRVMDCWLSLHPREFELLWRLAEQPGRSVPRRDLQISAGPVSLEPEGGRIAAYVAGLKAKLEPFGLAQMLVTGSQGDYWLDVPPGPSACRFEASADS